MLQLVDGGGGVRQLHDLVTWVVTWIDHSELATYHHCIGRYAAIPFECR